MPDVHPLPANDLEIFNRWCCTNRLRVVVALPLFAGFLNVLNDAATVPIDRVIECSLLLALVSVVGLTTTWPIRRPLGFLYAQMIADVILTSWGVYCLVPARYVPLSSPIFLLSMLTPAMVSVRAGVSLAAVSSVAYLGLLGMINGWQLTTFTGVPALVPVFVFGVTTHHAVFYAGRLNQKNRALAELAARLELAHALQSEFVGAVSHELRTPLSVILGYVEMLEDRAFGALTAEQADALQRIRHESSGLLEMITALLDLNRLESGRVPIERTRIAVTDLFAELSRNIPDVWRRPDVALHFVAPTPDVELDTDVGKLKTIVRNLVHNATKFTDRGSITVSAARLDERALAIRVADTGRGIPPEAIGFIFDRFRQVPGSGGGGVGLGLHMVSRLLDVIGGSVRVESRIGAGTTFTITLPDALRAPA